MASVIGVLRAATVAFGAATVGLTTFGTLSALGDGFWQALLWAVAASLASPLSGVALCELLLEVRCTQEVRKMRRYPGYILPPDDPPSLLVR
jgi:hypothetical protein